MAWSVRIESLRDSVESDGGAARKFQMEPVWWPEKILMEDPRFIETRDLCGYLDYSADLSLDEARELHERFKPLSALGVYSFEDWQKRIRPMVAELDAVFGSPAPEFHRFLVSVFEWESGY
jgi:hypothetical protein